MAEAAVLREGHITGVTTGLDRSRQEARRAAPLRPGHPRRAAVDGQDRARHQHRLQRRPGLSQERDRDRRGKVAEAAQVAFFSLEMSAEQLATRILAEQSAPPPTASAAATCGARISTNSSRPASASRRVPLYIDDTPALSVAALRTRARRLKRQQGLGLIVIDYLQLLRRRRRAGRWRTGCRRSPTSPAA